MLKYLILLSALLLATCAAIFSVSGIVALFSGAAIAVGFMAVAIELGKLVSISVLYRYWKYISNVLKFYLILALILASCITTLGIYGYLSAAYSSVALSARQTETTISSIDNQQQSVNDQIARLTERSKSLETARAQQEARLDRLVGHKGLADQQAAVRRVDGQLGALQSQITTLSLRKDSLEGLRTTAVNSITSDAHIGPFYYFAKAVNIPLDTIVKWFILAIVVVFDPLSICLLLTYNIVAVKEKKSTVKKETGKKHSKILSFDTPKTTTPIENIQEDIIQPPPIEQHDRRRDGGVVVT
jgi:cell division protein FtsL